MESFGAKPDSRTTECMRCSAPTRPLGRKSNVACWAACRCAASRRVSPPPTRSRATRCTSPMMLPADTHLVWRRKDPLRGRFDECRHLDSPAKARWTPSCAARRPSALFLAAPATPTVRRTTTSLRSSSVHNVSLPSSIDTRPRTKRPVTSAPIRHHSEAASGQAIDLRQGAVLTDP